MVCDHEDLSLTCPPVVICMESLGVAAIIRLTRLDASCRSVGVVGVAKDWDRINWHWQVCCAVLFASTCYMCVNVVNVHHLMAHNTLHHHLSQNLQQNSTRLLDTQDVLGVVARTVCLTLCFYPSICRFILISEALNVNLLTYKCIPCIQLNHGRAVQVGQGAENKWNTQHLLLLIQGMRTGQRVVCCSSYSLLTGLVVSTVWCVW